MLLKGERQDVVDACRRLITDGLTTGTGGNISLYNEDAGLVAMSPSGIDYFSMDAQDVVVMDLEGEIVEGQRKPSSEYQLHLIFYKGRQDVKSVVHTHSTYASVLATLGEGLPASSYLVAFAGREVPCAPYASFGTQKLAKLTYQAMGDDHRAVIMANHGLVALGKNLPTAFNVAQQIEQCAKVYVIARTIGTPIILPKDEMDTMVQRFDTGYGQVDAAEDRRID